MEKITVGILEDSPEIAQDLKEQLKDFESIRVLFHCTDSTTFLQKCKEKNPKAVILDIDLNGDPMSGLDVAKKLKLPTLFVSGKGREFYKEIEDINIELEAPVAQISKPVTKNKIEGILPKFLASVRQHLHTTAVWIPFGDLKELISVEKIVYITSAPGGSGKSNNKELFFNDRSPTVWNDFTLRNVHSHGFPKDTFLQISKNCVVNIDNIERKHTKSIEVAIHDPIKGRRIVELPVSPNYSAELRRRLKD